MKRKILAIKGIKDIAYFRKYISTIALLSVFSITKNVQLDIKQLFKFFVQGNAQHQGQLCGRIKLPCLNGADGLPGDAYQFGKISL